MFHSTECTQERLFFHLNGQAEGKLDLPIIGKQKVIDVANSFGIKTKRRQFNNIAKDVADVLLDDLSNTESKQRIQDS